MRTTLALDDELMAKARGLTGLTEKSAIVREALKALIAAGQRTGQATAYSPDPTVQRHATTVGPGSTKKPLG
jgi:Arc/MetJ family transcription regulator